MAQLGWKDGRDYVIDARFADGRADVVKGLAAELVATQPDLLLCPGDASARALADATKTIPIVFAVAADPVRNGLAKSMQRPAGNVTGLTTLSRDLSAKRVQLLKEAFPRVSHIVVLYEPSEPSGISQFKDMSEAATRLKLRVSGGLLRQPSDIDAAVERGIASGADGYAVATGFMVAAERRGLASALLRAKAPAIASSAVLAEAGVLMSYGPYQDQLFRQAAAYVDKIFRGANPGDLPVEQPTKFEMAVNVRTASAIGAAIPGSVLLRADRVIE
jgi:putative ABC transport system substrate-binding protein